MAKQWYRFWVRFHGPGGGTETYRYYQDDTSDQFLRENVGEWAEETSSDDGHYGYKCGFDEVDAPPLEWLRGKVSANRKGLIWRHNEFRELVDMLRQLEGRVESGPELKRRQDEIPVLPKKEVPEIGYRAIYDWVITNVHPDLLADGTKTVSELVIEMLEKALGPAK